MFGNTVKKVFVVAVSLFLFFCFTYIELKHQSDEPNKSGTNVSQGLIGKFWVCQLSSVCIKLTVFS